MRPQIMTKSELKRKRAWYRIMAGLMDFIGSIGGFIVILLCVALITTVLSWLKADIPETLNSVIDTVNKAIVLPE